MDIDLNYELIGKRFRSIRQRQKCTQELVSERAGISPQHYSGIECGSAKVSLPALVRLCNALEATPNDVLMDSIKEATPQLLKEVAKVFSDCSPNEIFLMLSQADNLKKSLRLKNIVSIERK